MEHNALSANSEPSRHGDSGTAPRRPNSESVLPGSIRLEKNRPETDPFLSRGYQHLQNGDFAAARSEYERAWRNDANNVDVLLGLAVIARHEGKTQEAEHFYRQALEANPKDAMAQAAAMEQAAMADTAAAESRLKSLLATQPESGPLHFTLGNIYSRQQYWAEAQQAYFNAVARDGDNPDYLFNLAVSLEHLRQPKLAARHYQLALEAAQRRPAGFDPDQASKRLQTLQ